MKWQRQKVKQVKHVRPSVVPTMHWLLCHAQCARFVVKRNVHITFARHVVQNNITPTGDKTQNVAHDNGPFCFFM